MTHYPGMPLTFCPEDVVLHDGDVVYVEARKAEFFYVGGLLDGGQIPLPRDYSVDILGAIALANGAVNGPTGGASNNFTTGPGNIVPPTKAIVSRKNADGSIVLIEVDLRRALGDPNERLIIHPGDIVMLKYRPHEIMANIGMNIINFNFLIPSGN
ncbi:MAG: hypothetical protein KDA84_09560 [Planctomycetaceae bacterium]|nr:hypothetical protein [Planctomycetaceae bacterium]